jgi:hypothetical protein
MPHVSQAEEESRAKRAFTILCDLHRRRVWFDERTTNAICDACFHPSSRYSMVEYHGFFLSAAPYLNDFPNCAGL